MKKLINLAISPKSIKSVFTVLFFTISMSVSMYGQGVNGPCPDCDPGVISRPTRISINGSSIYFTLTYEICGDAIKISSLSYHGNVTPNAASYMNFFIELFNNMPGVNTVYMDGNCAKWNQTSLGMELPNGGFISPKYELVWCSQIQCCVLSRGEVGGWDFTTMGYGAGDCDQTCFPACPY